MTVFLHLLFTVEGRRSPPHRCRPCGSVALWLADGLPWSVPAAGTFIEGDALVFADNVFDWLFLCSSTTQAGNFFLGRPRFGDCDRLDVSTIDIPKLISRCPNLGTQTHTNECNPPKPRSWGYPSKWPNFMAYFFCSNIGRVFPPICLDFWGWNPQALSWKGTKTITMLPNYLSPLKKWTYPLKRDHFDRKWIILSNHQFSENIRSFSRGVTSHGIPYPTLWEVGKSSIRVGTSSQEGKGDTRKINRSFLNNKTGSFSQVIQFVTIFML